MDQHHLLTLYHDPTSEPCRAVHWFALETGIELDIELTWLTRGEHRHADFLRINPAHQVPVLRHGDLCLPEAAAILVYLAELHGPEKQWVGQTVAERALTHRFMSWHHGNTRTTVTLDYALPVLLMPAYNGHPIPEDDEVQQLRVRLMDSLALLNNFLSGRGKFLGGKQPSIADIFISTDLFILDCDASADHLFKPFPVVSDWLDQLRARGPYQTSHAAWNAVAGHVKTLLSSPSTAGRNPDWVKDVCQPYFP